MTVQPYQCHLVKFWNFVARVIPVSGGPLTCLSRQSLLDAAVKETGKSDFGDTYFIEPMGNFLDSLEETGGLHSFGRMYVRKMILGFLTNRLKLVDLWKSHPEILEQQIKSPIVILGLPRTGTSYLFNSLSKDSAHRYLTNWETTVSQIPPINITTMENDPRRKIGRRLIGFQNYLAPQLKDIHDFGLDGPEECTPLLIQGFISRSLESMFNVPSYSKWLDSADYKNNYIYHKKILQTLQWAYPKERWLLKSPTHIEAMRELLSVYPDACIVQTHREPSKVVPSFASLCMAFRGICQEEIDLHQVGEQALHILSVKMNNCLVERKLCPSHHFFDVQYDDLVKSPTAILRSIYQYFDLNLSKEAEQQMRGFSAVQKKYASKHTYSLEDFGLNPKSVQKCFDLYAKKYVKSSKTIEVSNNQLTTA